MISVKEKEIDGEKYAVTQMTARQALKMQAKLIKLLGPCVSEAVAVAFSKEKKEDGLSKVIIALANQLDEKTFDGIVFELIQGVRKNGMELREGEINLEFAGALNTLFKVIGFVLEANYSDFLAEGGIIRMLLDNAKEQPPVVTTDSINQ